jgi:two-component system response regulator MprA
VTKILLVDDDESLTESLRRFLTKEDLDVEVAHSSADALAFLRQYDFDLVLLDWELPDSSGIEVCTAHRANGGTTPIIMLTGRNSINDKSTGLDCGADDYMAKPVHTRELLSRIRAVLRRPKSLAPGVTTIGSSQIDLNVGQVTRGGQTYQLTRRESALLLFFIRRPNKIFASRDVLEAVWPAEADASEDSVRTCVKTLRKKLADESDECPLKTVRGYGYLLELG